ncbi:hypothetical protein FXN63_12535 [Pigmentiphaga aceris]|uniref:Uncharacterized protein n=1 Tax=Pigmentiphaga aceris TaxID=1940612 RepID=A0A5C0AWL3_9BURK|nr:hypothetical protein [Pigmentiphaga aceris]QEI06565.1 hypothetical protein FXN63_12535 [Pigmentiphaga aceris]
MEAGLLILISGVMWWCLFHMQRLGALDPHHVEATPGKPAILLRSGATLLAILLIPIFHEVNPQWMQFFAMFALAQTVAVAFTSPDRYREDEQSDKVQNFIDRFKSSLAGAVIAKILAIVTAFLLGRIIGEWWFIVFVVIGFYVISSKGSAALDAIKAGGGGFSYLTRVGRANKVHEWGAVINKGRFAYFFGCTTFGFAILQFASLEPLNWMSWSGLIVGAVLNAVLSNVRF